MTGRQDEIAKAEAARRADLDRVLDTFGADPSRWPEAERISLLDWIAANPEAGRRLREAAAFDNLLDQARLSPGSADSRRALAGRIMAAAAAEPRAGQAIRPVAVSANAAVARVVPLRPRSPARSSDWTIAALMAASLALGFVAGSKGSFAPGRAVESAQAFADEAEDETILALGGDIDADDDTSAEEL